MGKWPLPPDAVKVAIAILADAMDPIRVSARMPKTRPLQFIRVEQVGGRMPNPATVIARILVEAWAPDIATASLMTRTAGKALRDASGSTVGDAFVRAWDNELGPVYYDDPDVTDQRRHLFHGDLSISSRGTTEGS